MFGPLDFEGGPQPKELRGIIPRCLDYLFAGIMREQQRASNGRLAYSCRCSYVEIYNETVYDLLARANQQPDQIKPEQHICRTPSSFTKRMRLAAEWEAARRAPRGQPPRCIRRWRRRNAD